MTKAAEEYYFVKNWSHFTACIFHLSGITTASHRYHLSYHSIRRILTICGKRVLLKRAEAMNMLFILTIFSTVFVVRMVTSGDTVDLMEPDYSISFANHNECTSTCTRCEDEININELLVSLKNLENASANAWNEEILMCLVQIFDAMNETEIEVIEHNEAEYISRDICDLYGNGIVSKHSILDLCMYDMDTIMVYYNNTLRVFSIVMVLEQNSTTLIDTKYSTTASSLELTPHSDRLEIYYDEYNSLADEMNLVSFAFLGLFSIVMLARFKRTTNDKCIQSDKSTSRTHVGSYGFISSISVAMMRYFWSGIDR